MANGSILLWMMKNKNKQKRSKFPIIIDDIDTFCCHVPPFLPLLVLVFPSAIWFIIVEQPCNCCMSSLSTELPRQIQLQSATDLQSTHRKGIITIIIISFLFMAGMVLFILFFCVIFFFAFLLVLFVVSISGFELRFPHFLLVHSVSLSAFRTVVSFSFPFLCTA